MGARVRRGWPPEVADGVYRLGTRWVNFHLVGDAGEFTLVDSGYPGYHEQLEEGLEALGARVEAVAGVVVTHHHVDHAGGAEAVRVGGRAAVYAHGADTGIVAGESRSDLPPGFYRQAWRPSMMRYLAHTVAAGGARYRAVAAVNELAADEQLDLPGRPRVIATPGHTRGHVSVVLDDRAVLLCGDALVNFDYAAGERGVKLHRFNEDRKEASESLARLERVDAEVLLFGHGDPWTRGAATAVAAARERLWRSEFVGGRDGVDGTSTHRVRRPTGSGLRT